jgi:hypothetical protein
MQSYLNKIAEINNFDISISDNKTSEWIFHHGMLFQSPYKWWQDHNSAAPAKRKTLHEGIDLLFLKDKNNQINKLKAGTLIPSSTDGRVINICDDFICKSAVVLHSISLKQKLDLVFIYAHIFPGSRINVGTELKQGSKIGSVADVAKKIPIPPHLHLSIAEIPKNIPAKNLNWDFFSNPTSEVNLINPLFV